MEIRELTRPFGPRSYTLVQRPAFEVATQSRAGMVITDPLDRSVLLDDPAAIAALADNGWIVGQGAPPAKTPA